jgi:protein TonB
MLPSLFRQEAPVTGSTLLLFSAAEPDDPGRASLPARVGLVALVAGLHLALPTWLGGAPVPVPRPAVPEVMVALLRPPEVLPSAPKPAAAPLLSPAAPRQAAPRPVLSAPTPAAPPTTDPAGLVQAPPAAAAEAAPAPYVEASAHAGYLRNPAPVYPDRARRMGWEGRALLRVLVLPSGRPERIELDRSSGYPDLDEAARETVKGWMFAPARRGSAAVEGWVQVPIEFKLGK